MNTERTTASTSAAPSGGPATSTPPVGELGGPTGPTNVAPATRAPFAAALGRAVPPPMVRAEGTRPDGTAKSHATTPRTQDWTAPGDARGLPLLPLLPRPVEAVAAMAATRGTVAVAPAAPMVPAPASAAPIVTAVPVEAGQAGRFVIFGDGSVVVTRSAQETAAAVHRSRQRGWSVTTPADAGPPPGRVP